MEEAILALELEQELECDPTGNVERSDDQRGLCAHDLSAHQDCTLG
jgi:hypothetical protein